MLERVLHLVASRGWAVSAPFAEAMREVLVRRVLRGDRLSESELADRLQAAERTRERASSAPTQIAVIQVYGLISHRAHMVDDISGPGGTSTERLGQQFSAALNDSSVAAIVLDIDSPGGSVEGVIEVADQIRAARGTKPIVAVANALAASAAYWIAAQADEVVVTPSGEVGSIGVYAMHEDWSRALAAEGVTLTFISAGPYKVDGNPYEPLSETAHEDMQSKVDAMYRAFVRSVAKGRGVSVDTVRKDFGQGRTLLAEDALAAGMVDRVDTFSNTLARVAAGKVTAAAPRKSAEVSEAPRLEADDLDLRQRRVRQARSAAAV